MRNLDNYEDESNGFNEASKTPAWLVRLPLLDEYQVNLNRSQVNQEIKLLESGCTSVGNCHFLSSGNNADVNPFLRFPECCVFPQ